MMEIFILIWSAGGIFSAIPFVAAYDAFSGNQTLWRYMRNRFSLAQLIIISIGVGPLFWLITCTFYTLKNVWWFLGRIGR